MVEAAVVLPLVILAVCAMLYYMVFMYAKVATSAQITMQSLAAAGSKSGTYEVMSAVPERGSVSYGWSGLHRQAVAAGNVSIAPFGILGHRYHKTMEASWYVLDEKNEILLADFVEEGLR